MKLSIKYDMFMNEDDLCDELSFDEMEAVHGGVLRPQIVVSDQGSFTKAEETLTFVRMNQHRTP